jgi:chorismate mutase
MQNIIKLRKKIDHLDGILLDSLARRMKVVREIGEYKKKHKLPAIDQERWNKLLEERKAAAQEHNLPQDLIEDIWNRIHQYSIETEQ